MASRSLGALTIDLIAKIGGFTRGMTEAERVADRKSREIARKQKARAKEAEKAWSDASRVITGAFAGISIVGLFASFTRETIDAQNEQTQLAAVLRSTGEAAGFSATQLNKMASEMAANSIFSDGEITAAQTRLLSYTGIVGEQFPQAMQAVIDMSARMGMSLEQSAETIGKALDVPSKGLTALSKQGFRFTDEQKELAEQLEKVGRTAEAQGIILDALKSSYGGAAAAARDTFGGAIKALQNELGSLMTGEGGSLDGATAAINELTNALQSEEVKRAFGTLTSLLADTINLLVTGATKFIEFGKAIGTGLAIRINGPDEPLELIAEQIGEVQREITSLDNLLNKPRKTGGLPFSAEELGSLNAQLSEARKRLADLQKTRDSFAPMTTGAAAPAGPAARPARGGRPLGPSKDEEQAAERAAKAAQAYLENLQRQLRGTEDLSVAETVLRDIQEGRLKLAGGVSKVQLLNIAQEIDAAREFEKIEKEFKKLEEESLERKKALKDAGIAVYDSTRTPIEELNIELARINKLLADGAINWDTWARASDAAQDKFEAATGSGKKVMSEMDEFTRRAAENIQDSIGDGLVDIMEGNFENIGDSFVKMINRMAAEALAADIARKLFGDTVKGGSGSGAIGDIFGSIVRSFFPGRANGGAVMAGGMYEVNENGPEMLAMGGRQYLMMGNQGGKVSPNAGGPSLNQTIIFQNNGPVDRRTQQQIAAQAAGGAQRALARTT